MRTILSPNFTRERERDGIKYIVDAIVLHITQGSSQSAINHFLSTRSQVSSHYLVDEQGEWIKMVSEEDTAWHAGKMVKSIWGGIKHYEGAPVNPNLYTIGIEVALSSASMFPSIRQWLSVARLVKDIRSRYGNLPLVNHNEIRADKLCPGQWMSRQWIDLLTKYV